MEITLKKFLKAFNAELTFKSRVSIDSNGVHVAVDNFYCSATIKGSPSKSIALFDGTFQKSIVGNGNSLNCAVKDFILEVNESQRKYRIGTSYNDSLNITKLVIEADDIILG